MSAPTEHVLDLLIVGGGPAGTAAAFRARELGLDALVIEYDDLMKRIRDYSKDKLILPSFGGGDRMRFPRGGELIDALRFSPIDKDDMCATWKGHYGRGAVPRRLGIELTGLSRRPDARGHDIYEASIWDHGQRCDGCLLARHVVLAIGRGVPRRFDIPGNTEGIPHRLDDPATYVGRPTCILGGGTSAAEAVIAISHAKAQASDPSAIYWSYRGDKMPRVSKALAEVFFEAYVGNGNIRYYPNSEPAAVLVGDDRQEYLAVRVDRRKMEGRPAETSHLEFPKDSCIACIGEDIPESLLASFGIAMVTGGPKNRKRMVTNRYLETALPHVYLAGDILSQAYFETDDFDADPAGFREIRHRGNIKSALRDGVLIAQVVRQRLEGKSDIDLTVADADDLEGAAESPVAHLGRTSVATSTSRLEREDLAEALEAAGATEPAGEHPADSYAAIVQLLPGNVQGEEHPIAPGSVVTFGRQDCDLNFPADPLLSNRHASIAATDEGTFLRDDGSNTGVFLRVPARRKLPLEAGDLLRAGRQFLLLADADATGNLHGDLVLRHFDAEGREIGQHPLPNGTLVLGRRAPDITLGPDGTLSRRHLALTVERGADQKARVLVKDLKSANGTYLRVRSAVKLEHGDQFQLGQQNLAFSQDPDAVLDASGPAPPRPVSEVKPAATPAAGSPAPDGPSVTFRGHGGPLPVLPGQTLCDVAEAHGIRINAECHSGICGSDPIRIVAGLENVETPAAAGEVETLEDLCGLEGKDCRLACMARIKGPVEVEIL